MFSSHKTTYRSGRNQLSPNLNRFINDARELSASLRSDAGLSEAEGRDPTEKRAVDEACMLEPPVKRSERVQVYTR